MDTINQTTLNLLSQVVFVNIEHLITKLILLHHTVFHSGYHQESYQPSDEYHGSIVVFDGIALKFDGWDTEIPGINLICIYDYCGFAHRFPGDGFNFRSIISLINGDLYGFRCIRVRKTQDLLEIYVA